jgi:hypothetical protein
MMATPYSIWSAVTQAAPPSRLPQRGSTEQYHSARITTADAPGPCRAFTPPVFDPDFGAITEAVTTEGTADVSGPLAVVTSSRAFDRGSGEIGVTVTADGVTDVEPAMLLPSNNIGATPDIVSSEHAASATLERSSVEISMRDAVLLEAHRVLGEMIAQLRSLGGRIEPRWQVILAATDTCRREIQRSRKDVTADAT